MSQPMDRYIKTLDRFSYREIIWVDQTNIDDRNECSAMHQHRYSKLKKVLNAICLAPSLDCAIQDYMNHREEKLTMTELVDSFNDL